MRTIYSHPQSKEHTTGKDLLTHLRGVYTKCLANMEHLPDAGTDGFCRKDYALATLYVCFWHDMGKLNPIFQKYLTDASFAALIKTKSSDCDPDYYKSHALMGAYGFLLWLTEAIATDPTKKLPSKRVLSILNVINRHHGDLRSRGIEADRNEKENEWRMFTQGEDTKLKAYLTKYPMSDVGEFYSKISELTTHKVGVSPTFGVACNEKHLKLINPIDVDTKKSVDRGLLSLPIEKNGSTHPKVNHNVQEFMFQQWLFSALCEADKRDASYNSVYTLADLLTTNQEQLATGLVSFKQQIVQDSVDSPLSEMMTQLNSVRSEMQQESAKSLLRADAGERVFSLTAPTGSGKTIMLLQLAAVLQERHPELSVVYCLPFLSITDQVTEILEKYIGVNVLTVTSLAEKKKKGSKLPGALDDDEAFIEPKEKAEDDKSASGNWTSLTFDHPFIVTTFVQLFETLLSNRNGRLLKLVNLKNRVFLMDEVQALPPNMYPFFSALLREFCYLHNCYAILSTATMPDFTLYPPFIGEGKGRYKLDTDLVFSRYKLPVELLTPDIYYKNPVFNRYKLTFNNKIDNYNKLGAVLCLETKNTMAICNTIAESRKTFLAMSSFPPIVEERKTRKFLLNTRFTPEHRREIIREIQAEMKLGTLVVLVSTSLVEAGVDLDFYKVYRDLCPWSNLIQAAGRDNRNYMYEYGEVIVLEMRVVDKMDNSGEDAATVVRSENKSRYIHSFIYDNAYTKEVKDFLLANPHSEEKDLYPEQIKHFGKLCKNLSLGNYSYRTETNAPANGNLVKELVELDVEKLGKFSLINNGDGDHEYTYFVRRRCKGGEDVLWQQWCDVWRAATLGDGRIDRQFRKRINELRRDIVQKCVTIRFKLKDGVPNKFTPAHEGDEVGGIYLLMNYYDYSEELGLNFV